MTAPTGASGIRPRELIEVLELTASHGPLEAALGLLAAAGSDPGTAEGYSLGQRDRLLLELRAHELGDVLEVVARCPACGLDVEATLSCAALSSVAPAAGDPTWRIDAHGYRLWLRAISSTDERRAAVASDVAEGRLSLLAAAVLSARRDGRPVRPEALPDKVVEAIERSIVDHDPMVEIELLFACPECLHEWPEVLQPVQLVPAELAGLGRALLGDVDLLARTYGWSEDAILGLPAERREAYVALASA